MPLSNELESSLKKSKNELDDVKTALLIIADKFKENPELQQAAQELRVSAATTARIKNAADELKRRRTIAVSVEILTVDDQEKDVTERTTWKAVKNPYTLKWKEYYFASGDAQSPMQESLDWHEHRPSDSKQFLQLQGVPANAQFVQLEFDGFTVKDGEGKKTQRLALGTETLKVTVERTALMLTLKSESESFSTNVMIRYDSNDENTIPIKVPSPLLLPRPTFVEKITLTFDGATIEPDGTKTIIIDLDKTQQTITLKKAAPSRPSPAAAATTAAAAPDEKKFEQKKEAQGLEQSAAWHDKGDLKTFDQILKPYESKESEILPLIDGQYRTPFKEALTLLKKIRDSYKDDASSELKDEVLRITNKQLLDALQDLHRGSSAVSQLQAGTGS